MYKEWRFEIIHRVELNFSVKFETLASAALPAVLEEEEVETEGSPTLGVVGVGVAAALARE